MQVVKAAVPIAVAMAIVSAVTAVLCTVRAELVGPQHLVFFYLLPTALVAVLYGRLPAMFWARSLQRSAPPISFTTRSTASPSPSRWNWANYSVLPAWL